MLELIHFLPTSVFLTVFSLIILTLYYSWDLYKMFFMLITPLFFVSLIGSYRKEDLRILPLLLVVMPIQIFGYGIGFLQAFIRRFIFNESELTGFKKNYYK